VSWRCVQYSPGGVKVAVILGCNATARSSHRFGKRSILTFLLFLFFTYAIQRNFVRYTTVGLLLDGLAVGKRGTKGAEMKALKRRGIEKGCPLHIRDIPSPSDDGWVWGKAPPKTVYGAYRFQFDFFIIICILESLIIKPMLCLMNWKNNPFGFG